MVYTIEQGDWHLWDSFLSLLAAPTRLRDGRHNEPDIGWLKRNLLPLIATGERSMALGTMGGAKGAALLIC